VHVSKTAGTSMNKLLALNFKRQFESTSAVLNEPQYTSEQVEKIFRLRRNVRCLCGHKISLDLPFESEELDLRAFTTIRDPVQRVESVYYFLHDIKHRYSSPSHKFKTFEDYVENKFSKVKEADHHIKFLTGMKGEEGFNHIKGLLDKYPDRLTLIPLKKLGEGLTLLHNLYPEDFRFTKIKRLKTSSRPRREIDPEHRELILRSMRWDQALYEFTLERFSQYDRKLRKTPAPEPGWRYPLSEGLRWFSQKMDSLADRVQP